MAKWPSVTGAARKGNMTSRTASRAVTEEASAPASVMNDEKTHQSGNVDLEAGNRPEMQEEAASNEPAACYGP